MNYHYSRNTAGRDHILAHLKACDNSFAVPLSGRLVLTEYAAKLKDLASLYEAWFENHLVGLVACYENEKSAYITNVSVVPIHTGEGIARTLMMNCLRRVFDQNLSEVTLEVHQDSNAAISLYQSLGFVEQGKVEDNIQMIRTLQFGESIG